MTSWVCWLSFYCVHDRTPDLLITWAVNHTWSCIVLQNGCTSVSSQDWWNIEECSPPRLPSFSLLPTYLVYLDEVVILWKPNFLEPFSYFVTTLKRKSCAKGRTMLKGGQSLIQGWFHREKYIIASLNCGCVGGCGWIWFQCSFYQVATPVQQEFGHSFRYIISLLNYCWSATLLSSIVMLQKLCFF